ncbi:dihydropteroate synthase [Candidatus Poribacteria bacterium]|nr:dihydropteroate synthase [Candidatus Poribacteria bacterium]
MNEINSLNLDEINRTLVMGILNVTPDSFSDGGKFNSVARAVEHARKMVEDGADIIDLGGESSRPGSLPVPEEVEIERVLPVIEKLVKFIDVPISIDTYKSPVARQALEAGATIINDISALRYDPDMASVAVDAGVPVILMHMKGTPRDMQRNPHYKSLIPEIISFFSERINFALKEGISHEQIIIDPGIGFGKTIDHNLEIIRRLRDFKVLDKPILMGTSRKSFIGKILDLQVEDRLEGTAATVVVSICNGADIVRVHDVKEIVKVARMTDAIVRPNFQF